ncbi:hypothetical protein pdul_cds_922 [Pandoravirus dulcis]|uniref:Uncharacterized protein n=1 Tax=Pandoravirus dulcis TaxID=1349409 RepID=S4VRZ7_9VIRU|nr:hypothetical protein pdul_cds_922 [Pandoravirus dulcis]AGO83163.1 hypothetical protein pdul_cds_922 [Pandoravirus dulcis]
MEVVVACAREDVPTVGAENGTAPQVGFTGARLEPAVHDAIVQMDVDNDDDDVGDDHKIPKRGDRAVDEDQVAALIARVDPGRLRRATLLGRCFEVLVPVGRLCAAFARAAPEAPWSDWSPLAEALRAHTNFADAARALQYAVARVPHGGALPPAFVACCGCNRPWCAGRPCAAGWMRPIDQRAYRRLLAWQWAEHGVSGLNTGAVFGGFYARELIQCVEPDAGHRLTSCRRWHGPAGDRDAKRPCRRVSPVDGGAAGTGPEPTVADGAAVDIIAAVADRRQRRDAIDRARGDSDEHTRGPLLLSCGPRCVITIRDSAVYASALAAACRRDLDDMPHPSQPALRGRVALGTGAVERWVRVAGDAFIVRVHLPSTEAAPWDAHG